MSQEKLPKKDHSINWGAVATGAICIALAFAFSMGYTLNDNIAKTKNVSNVEQGSTTTTAPKAPAQP